MTYEERLDTLRQKLGKPMDGESKLFYLKAENNSIRAYYLTPLFYDCRPIIDVQTYYYNAFGGDEKAVMSVYDPEEIERIASIVGHYNSLDYEGRKEWARHGA